MWKGTWRSCRDSEGKLAAARLAGREPRTHSVRGMHRSCEPGTPRGRAIVRGRKPRPPCEMRVGGNWERWGAKGDTGAVRPHEHECGARHRRPEALEAAVQADPGIRDAAVALTGRPEEGNEGHRQGLYYPWDQRWFGGGRSLRQHVLDRPPNAVHHRRQSQAESGNYSR